LIGPHARSGLRKRDSGGALGGIQHLPPRDPPESNALETICLLHLVPLAQIAWASGSVTPQERKLVLQLSEWRGVEKGSPAWEQLNRWLDERPTDEFFLTTLRIIRHILDSDTGNPYVASRTDLISFCIRIAKASGGFLGVGSRVSEEEQAALDQIAEELTRRNPEAVRQVVEAD
jgi:hypothetical protein